MTARLLTAGPVVEKIKKDLVQRCEALKKSGFMPSMAVVLVGDNPASLSYIKNKKNVCEEVGAKFTLKQYSKEISEEAFLNEIDTLNHDPSINGIIIQLPVSDSLKKLNIPNLVVAHKDIDGFHGKNSQNIYAGSTDMNLLLPCTPKGIICLLNHYKVPVSGKHAVIIGRSLIVGKPLSMMLSNLNATVTLAHSKTKDLQTFTRRADIVVAAIGIPRYLTADYFNIDSSTFVIDVGINSVDGKLCGDVDTENVAKVVAGITPVPGGVGPMTVVGLIENLITASEKQMKGMI